MPDVIKIKRGVDIKLVGEADKKFSTPKPIESVALKPDDFNGVRFKLSVKEGDEVKAGSPLFFNKDNEQVQVCSPVSGEVTHIIRGDKRKILEVRVRADKAIKYMDFGSANPEHLKRDEIISKLMASGCFPFFKQRPYNVVADPMVVPKAIFISGFDSAPLAPDMALIMQGQEKEFSTGIAALAKLTSGKVHLGLKANVKTPDAFSHVKNLEIHFFDGPHPAGLVGVQIAQISPINKGETVWTISPEHVAIIGRLFLKGIFDARISIALTGSEVKEKTYHRTLLGASATPFTKGNITDGKNRIISGNVLTGTKIEADGYLSFFERQITVIPEGEEPELFGWLIPKPDKFSISRTLPSWFQRQIGEVTYNLDTNQHGERRAFVVTGEYEKVFPFDIYPVQLLKAVITNDIDAMENLGMYEVVEEDFALCEVVCTSKIEVQQIVREGLDMLRQEMG